MDLNEIIPQLNMRHGRLCLIALFSAFALETIGQDELLEPQSVDEKKTTKIFNHLDLSVTMGTTGIGVDVAMPVGDVVQLRTGFTYMPRFHQTMHFGIKVGDESLSEEEEAAKFSKLSGMLAELTGTEVDNTIDMVGTPTFQNFKFLVDLFPFKNKHWHFTGGFYWGPSRVAKAINAVYDATSLVSVSFYNSLYDRIYASYLSDGDVPYISISGTQMYANYDLVEKLENYGKMGVHIGEYKEDGSAYRMVPGDDNTVSAKIEVNSFRPYVGFGYGGRLVKGNDNYYVSFDCGIMFWGGTPKVLTYNYEETGLYDEETYMPIYERKEVDLAKDITNIRGKVGTYVDVIKKFKAFPVISVRFTRRIF